MADSLPLPPHLRVLAKKPIDAQQLPSPEYIPPHLRRRVPKPLTENSSSPPQIASIQSGGTSADASGNRIEPLPAPTTSISSHQVSVTPVGSESVSPPVINIGGLTLTSTVKVDFAHKPLVELTHTDRIFSQAATPILGKGLSKQAIMKALEGQPKEDLFAVRNGYANITSSNRVEIYTNHWRITAASGLYVYIATIHTEACADGRAINQGHRNAIFSALQTSTSSSLRALPWASDQQSTIFSRANLSTGTKDPVDTEEVPIRIKDIAYINPFTKAMVNATVDIRFDQYIELSRLTEYSNGNDPGFNTTLAHSALNALFSWYPSMRTEALTQIGANRFFLNDAKTALDKSLDVKRGYTLAVKSCMAGPLLNVDLKNAVFHAPVLVSDFVRDYFRINQVAFATTTLSDQQVAILNGILFRVKVSITYIRSATAQQSLKSIAFLGKVAREQTITEQRAGNHKSHISVEDFFRREHLLQLKFRNLPCINVGSVRLDEVDKHIWIPAEYLLIEPDQLFRGKFDAERTTTMLGITTRRPAAIANTITNEGKPAIGIQENHSQVSSLDIGAEDRMAKIEASALKPPRLVALNNISTKTPFSPRIEDAAYNLIGVRFHKPCPLPLLRVFRLAPSKIDNKILDQLLGAFEESLRKYGLGTSKHHVLDIATPTSEELSYSLESRQAFLKNFDDGFSKSSAAFSLEPNQEVILVIKPTDDSVSYAIIKRYFDAKFGIPTQCVVSTKLSRKKNNLWDLAYFGNVAMKLNLKLGGTTLSLAKLGHDKKPQFGGKDLHTAEETMVMGTDVTHPSPGATQGTPSIATVVATVDGRLSHYLGSMRLQESKTEVIVDLEAMTLERLRAWYNIHKADKKNSLPQAILFYRDGVSESQFKTSRDQEIPAIRRACEAAGKILKLTSYEPPITFIIVNKRHSTRFFPVREQDSYKSYDREAKCRNVNGNIKPGTVVDRGITSAYWYDFYIQSHAALEGTARSSHYYVLCDDTNKWEANILQLTTHNLCYCFPRATTAVSYVTPAYLADRLCDRGKTYLQELQRGTWVRPAEIRKIKDQKRLKTAMVNYVKQDKDLWACEGSSGVGPWKKELDNVMFWM